MVVKEEGWAWGCVVWDGNLGLQLVWHDGNACMPVQEVVGMDDRDDDISMRS